FLNIVFVFTALLAVTAQVNAQSRSDVYLQGFYWNSLPGGVWYDSLAKLAPRLASAGFGGIWFPSPAKGAAGALSMGYDPYDHFDFGDYNQKGSVETRFGSRAELEAAIRAFHNVGMQVYADAVMNHMIGGEQKIPYTCKPYVSFPDSAYLLFQYPNGSGRFKKDASFFYPNSITCDVNPPYHGASDPLFAFGEWLAKDLPKVRDSLITWGHYLKQNLGFDGFRLDAVKAIDPAFMGPWLNAVNGSNYAVSEYYGDLGSIMYWHNQTQNVRGGKTQMFDFPLRFTLQDMCNNTGGSFDMNILDGAGLINAGMSGFDVCTWVENHDVDRIGWDGSIDNGHTPIITNKEMAYAYVIFSEGRPSVFFKDYFMYGFAGKLDTLIWIRQQYLGGGTTKRGGLNAYYIRQDGNVDQGMNAKDIYVARRDGYGSQPGGYLVVNDNSSQWIDIWVDTEKPIGTKYRDFTGNDADKIVVGPSAGGVKNRVKLWAKPRNYAIYVADTTQSIGNAPVLMPVPDLTGYTNSKLSYKLLVSDANNQVLTYSLSGNPSWLTVSSAGILLGTPSLGDTGIVSVTVKVADPGNLFAVDTFSVRIVKNFSPHFSTIRDTVIRATKRFELQTNATDPDADTLVYSFNSAPGFLNIAPVNGLISGTPALADTGLYAVKLLVTDKKGAYDSLSFQLTVKKAADSVIYTFGKPKMDGTVNVGDSDWLARWQVAADPDTDSRWNPRDTTNNEIIGVFATWDADSLYLGCHYVINDLYNTMMLYVDAGIPGGVTNFNSNAGYNGDYAKNFRFRSSDAVDFFIADYHRDLPTMFKISGNTTVNMTDSINRQRGPGGYDNEIGIAWNDIYGLGAGKVPANVSLKMVALVAGGFNYGAGDSAPDNVDVDGNAGPDSLINLAVIRPDADGNGFPDPTIIVGTEKETRNTQLPKDFALQQNYPNPFNPVTVIGYQLPSRGLVTVRVFDMLGREVKQLVNEFKEAGSYSVQFNAAGLASGVYVYRLSCNGFSATKKLTLLK
ncbi:MAG: T9SS type A sorting domain-containing protein, partial [Ignavibacteriales bacterium]|nr:T9SS type A sorting domain-containing protein [Ignavibacteriales bacterium]